MRPIICYAFCSAVAFAAVLMPSAPAAAQAVGKGISNLELPRFVSLKASRANLRVGPGRNYAVDWTLVKPGTPLEVVQEFELWRRVRYADGTEGWLYHSLLSGKRMATTAPWKASDESSVHIEARAKAAPEAAITAKFEPNVLVEVRECDGTWCNVRHQNGQGWIRQTELWGVYPQEKIDG
ncbi:MAG: SH3 domain-containing protein [Pseudomonadota bacterium]